MPDCPFCNIIAGKAPARKVYEDSATFALLDLYPVVPGHTLVLTKQHIPLLTDVEPDQWAEVAQPFFRATHLVALKLKQALDCDCVTLLLRGKRVPHIHMHLVPSWPDRKHLLDLNLQIQDYCQPRLKAQATDAELDAIAEKIRTAPVS